MSSSMLLSSSNPNRTMMQSKVIELMIQRPTNTDPESMQGSESESSSSQDRELESRPKTRVNIELIDKSRCNPTRGENPGRNYGKADLSWVSHYVFLIISKSRILHHKDNDYISVQAVLCLHCNSSTIFSYIEELFF